MIVTVIDGMGGGIGVRIVTQLRQVVSSEIEIIALGANAVATDRMLQAGADRGASGTNAIRTSTKLADFIIAPIGVIVPNAMLGEITPEIAEAVAGAPGTKLLIPMGKADFRIVGLEDQSLSQLIGKAVDAVKQAVTSQSVHLTNKMSQC